MKLLVTGGAGFIGSAFVRMMLGAKSATRLINYDKLTYAGNLENLVSIADDPRYRFVQGDICDAQMVNDVVAAERHGRHRQFRRRIACGSQYSFTRAGVRNQPARDVHHARSRAVSQDAAVPSRFHR